MAGEHLVYVGAQEMLIFFCFLESSKENLEVSFNMSREGRQIPARQKHCLLFNKILKYLNKVFVLPLSRLNRQILELLLLVFFCFLFFLYLLLLMYKWASGYPTGT